MVKKLLLAGLLCACVALAQRGGGGGKNSSSGDTGVPMPTGAATKFDRIATTLNLNKDQKKAARAIIDEAAKEAAPLRDQISKSRIVVGEAITAKKNEDELKQVAKASSDLSVQLTQLELNTFNKIFGLLDDTQKKDQQALGRTFVLMTDIFHGKNWNED
jgi:hypothetical protein